MVVCQLPDREPVVRLADQGDDDPSAEPVRVQVLPLRQVQDVPDQVGHRRVGAGLVQVQAGPAAEEQAHGQEDQQAEGHRQAGGRQRRRHQELGGLHPHPHRGRLGQDFGKTRA